MKALLSIAAAAVLSTLISTQVVAANQYIGRPLEDFQSNQPDPIVQATSQSTPVVAPTPAPVVTQVTTITSTPVQVAASESDCYQHSAEDKPVCVAYKATLLPDGFRPLKEGDIRIRKHINAEGMEVDDKETVVCAGSDCQWQDVNHPATRFVSNYPPPMRRACDLVCELNRETAFTAVYGNRWPHRDLRGNRFDEPGRFRTDPEGNLHDNKTHHVFAPRRFH